MLAVEESSTIKGTKILCPTGRRFSGLLPAFVVVRSVSLFRSFRSVVPFILFVHIDNRHRSFLHNFYFIRFSGAKSTSDDRGDRGECRINLENFRCSEPIML